MKTIQVSSLEQVLELSDSQVTAQELLNERLYIKGVGWSNIALTGNFRAEIAENIAMRLGGRQNTKDVVAWVLKHRKPQHWGLGRFILQQYGSGKPFIGYVAGQDQQYEANEIRTFLKRL